MRFSTRTRYGLRFLIRLAALPEGERLKLGHVARDENISPGYLEQIVRALKPLGILHAVRGASGGYALIRQPEEISMEDLFLHLEGEISPVACLTRKLCRRSGACATRGFWRELDVHIRRFLRSRTLADIMSEKPCLYESGKNVTVPANARANARARASRESAARDRRTF